MKGFTISYVTDRISFMMSNSCSKGGGYMKYLIENKEWIFSGIGVLIVGAIANLFKKRHTSKNQPSISQSGHNNFQSNGNITNSNNTTYVYTEPEKELEKKSPLSELISKFYFIFEQHGVSRSQIPSFIDKKFNLNYADVASEDSIIPKLNDELLEWISSKFGIRRSWFDTVDEVYSSRYIYDTLDCYKWVGAFINLFSKLIDELNVYSYRDSLHVYFLKNFEEFKGDKYGETEKADVIVIVSVKIGKTTTNSVEKYILITSNLRWDYWKSRQDIKRMIRIVEKLDIGMSGYDISIKEYNALQSSQVVPRAILKGKNRVTWYPYDYDGSHNDRIDKVEYEPDEEFYESLKRIDKNIAQMINEKRDKYSNSFDGLG
jgi:hypothetical protein